MKVSMPSTLITDPGLTQIYQIKETGVKLFSIL